MQLPKMGRSIASTFYIPSYGIAFPPFAYLERTKRANAESDRDMREWQHLTLACFEFLQSTVYE